jgi:hypothetical protein
MVYECMAERTLYFLRSAKKIYLYHRLTTCRNYDVEHCEDRVLKFNGFLTKSQRPQSVTIRNLKCFVYFVVLWENYYDYFNQLHKTVICCFKFYSPV